MLSRITAILSVVPLLAAAEQTTETTSEPMVETEEPEVETDEPSDEPPTMPPNPPQNGALIRNLFNNGNCTGPAVSNEIQTNECRTDFGYDYPSGTYMCNSFVVTFMGYSTRDCSGIAVVATVDMDVCGADPADPSLNVTFTGCGSTTPAPPTTPEPPTPAPAVSGAVSVFSLTAVLAALVPRIL